jgi:hypothetical protein
MRLWKPPHNGLSHNTDVSFMLTNHEWSKTASFVSCLDACHDAVGVWQPLAYTRRLWSSHTSHALWTGFLSSLRLCWIYRSDKIWSLRDHVLQVMPLVRPFFVRNFAKGPMAWGVTSQFATFFPPPQFWYFGDPVYCRLVRWIPGSLP